MDLPSFNQTIVLKIRTLCCSSYQKKLKKKLSKLYGVYSVSMDPEKNLVSVTGKIDPNVLVKAVYETRKFAEIVWPDGNERNRSRREEGREEEEHRCEEYTPPKFNNRMCRDYYCTDHRQMAMFRNTAPEDAGFFHHFPRNPAGNHYRRRPWELKEPVIGGYWPGRDRCDSYGHDGRCSMM